MGLTAFAAILRFAWIDLPAMWNDEAHTFRRVTGITPHQYVLRTRLHRAAIRLRQSEDQIAAIAFDAGFNDLATFNRRFRRLMGAAPGEYRGFGTSH